MRRRQGYAMTDGELRGLLLEKYYQRRKERLIGLAPPDFDGKLSEQEILNIAGQLADGGLIHWRPNRGHGGIGGGMGTITAAGVDVVESKVPAPMEIRWSQDRSLQPCSLSAAIPASETRPGVGVAIEQLAHAIDATDAGTASKREATSLLRAFQEHPLVRAIAQHEAARPNDDQPKPEAETANQTTGETH
jgi:hypothetical protein